MSSEVFPLALIGHYEFWDLKAGGCIGELLRGRAGLVSSMAMVDVGQLIVSGCGDRTLRIQDLKAGSCTGEPLRGHTNQVHSVTISHDGRRIVSGSFD